MSVMIGANCQPVCVWSTYLQTVTDPIRAITIGAKTLPTLPCSIYPLTRRTR